VIIIIICVLIAGVSVFVYNKYILPNTDSTSTVTINGQTFTQYRKIPVTFYNEGIDMRNNFYKKQDVINKLTADNTTLSGFQAALKDVNSTLDLNIQTLKNYSTNLINYNDYKDYINSEIDLYNQYKSNMNTTYSDVNIASILNKSIAQDEYNRVVIVINTYNSINKQLDANFDKLQDGFRSVHTVK